MINATHQALKRYALLSCSLGLLVLPLLISLRPEQQFINRGETVNLPRHVSNAAPVSISPFQGDTRIVLSIPQDGVTYLGKFRSTGEHLIEDIKKLAEARPARERIVYVKGGAGVSHGSIIDALKIVRAAGIDRVRLLVKKETGENRDGFLEVRLPACFPRQACG